MTFPRIQPSTRSLVYGEYPVQLYRSQSGAVITRLFGDRPSNFQLQLTFNGLDAAKLEEILAHYDSVKGGFEGFLLPSDVWAGEDNDLRDRYQNLVNVTWYYISPPEIESIRGTTNRNVSIQLNGNTYA